MLFNEFGSKDKPVLLCLHGMMEDWRSIYRILKPLEEHYRLLVTSLDGFHDGSQNFTSFADQARQLEEYVKEHHNGRLHGALGFSQGCLMMTELLTRNNIKIEKGIMDGGYVAHQGKIAGWVTAKMFCKFKNTGKFPAIIHIMTTLMGVKLEDMMGDLGNTLYLKATDESVMRNFMENYTYHVRPEIANTETKVYLWCGSKEPYAIKSHNILKRHLKHYEEKIMEGYGHGDFLMKHTEECCKKILDTIR